MALCIFSDASTATLKKRRPLISPSIIIPPIIPLYIMRLWLDLMIGGASVVNVCSVSFKRRFL